jgi:hypothetical protein
VSLVPGAQDYYRRLMWVPIDEESYEGEHVTVMMLDLSTAAFHG